LSSASTAATGIFANPMIADSSGIQRRISLDPGPCLRADWTFGSTFNFDQQTIDAQQKNCQRIAVPGSELRTCLIL